MKNWQNKYKKGIHYLSVHKPSRALKLFYNALNICPFYENRALSKVLFFLGITLKRLGFTDFAIKSWISSQKIHKDKYVHKMIKRFVNEYGMCRRSSRVLDDWQAFYSIQLVRYLNSKRKFSFCSQAEKDMIRELIFDHFKRLKQSGALNNKTAIEKKRIFKRERIIFPFVLKDKLPDDPIIHVNFFQNKKINPEDRCPCGSGLHFIACCGRTPGEKEVLSGNF